MLYIFFQNHHDMVLNACPRPFPPRPDRRDTRSILYRFADKEAVHTRFALGLVDTLDKYPIIFHVTQRYGTLQRSGGQKTGEPAGFEKQ